MKSKTIFGIVLGLLVAGAVSWRHFSSSDPTLPRSENGASGPSNAAFSFAGYAAVLSAYVNDQGLVNYKELKAHRQRLDIFVSAIEKVKTTEYGRWGQEEQIAFWINAYNALTLLAVVNNYPIEPMFLETTLFPENSIRQIPGVWDQLQFTVMGHKLTLDQIEHEILRKRFDEPRIHMALVCAARSCPPLRNEPFVGNRLGGQLDDQTRKFLSGPSMLRIERDTKRVFLSSIFKWYGEDFVKTFGTSEKFRGYRQAERAVLNFISRYLDEQDRDYLAKERYRIEYLHYDWSLNEQAELLRLS